MLSVTYKPFIPSVVILNVVMLSDVAPSSSIEVSLSNALSVKNFANTHADCDVREYKPKFSILW